MSLSDSEYFLLESLVKEIHTTNELLATHFDIVDKTDTGSKIMKALQEEYETSVKVLRKTKETKDVA